MPASYVVEFYDRVHGFRVSWPRAKNDESAGHVIKCRVCWPRAKNDELAGHVIKSHGSLNDYNHNIYASNNAFINNYQFLYKDNFFNFFFIIIQNEAYSCQTHSRGKTCNHVTSGEFPKMEDV